MFGRSAFVKLDLPANHKIEESDVSLLKPGGGIPPSELKSIVGKILNKDYSKGEMLRREDLV